MGTTQPIRNIKELTAFRMYYRNVKPNFRNYSMIVLGLNTALRINDLLLLKWEDVYNFKKDNFRSHLLVFEQKTGKKNYILLNDSAKNALNLHFAMRSPRKTDYIFTKNTDYSRPLSRSQAYRIIKAAAIETVNEKNISCHSLRKTFGYHAWRQGTQPALLMDIYNHSSYKITRRYLGIEQDDKDSVYEHLQL